MSYIMTASVRITKHMDDKVMTKVAKFPFVDARTMHNCTLYLKARFSLVVKKLY